ncbi:MAG TPA: head GIN domain-containing protein [Bacteroidales bacterium]|nr:head GIN domain-containing protein [Bacteroidales bacterium]
MKRKYISLGILCLSVILSSCEDIWNHCIDGNGNRIADTRMLDPFEEIQVNGDFEVQIDTGQVISARVEADDNLMGLVVTHVTGNRLIIETRNGDCIRPSRPIEITVTVPSLHTIKLNGSGYVYSYGLSSEELEVRLSGSGQITCHNVESTIATFELEGSGSITGSLITGNLTALVEGSGDIRLSGSSVNSDLKILGSGRINANQVNTDVCLAYISGSGIIETFVNNALDVTIIGSGTVYYEGNPSVESYISGSGKVVRQ